MKSGACRFIFFFILLLTAAVSVSAETREVFSVFQADSYQESDAGVLINAVYKGSQISVRSFDQIEPAMLQQLEDYLINVLYTDPGGLSRVKIRSIEILVNSRGAAADIVLEEFLIEVNDILAVDGGEVFRNRFTITFDGTSALPRTVFPETAYNFAGFRDEGEQLLLTGFHGWSELAGQIRDWVREGYETRDEDVLGFVYNNRLITDADSKRKWDEILILPPADERLWVSGLQVEIGGANLLKHFGGETSVGFGSLTVDFMYTMQPERVPDQTNFRIFDYGWGAGLFFEIDSLLQRRESAADLLSTGLCGAGNFFIYLPGIDDSMIKKDSFALGAELLLRLNLVPLMDGSDFLNDNDYLLHLSPRLIFRLPLLKKLGFDLVLGAPSLRFAVGGDPSFSLLTLGIDTGLRGSYTFDRRLF